LLKEEGDEEQKEKPDGTDKDVANDMMGELEALFAKAKSTNPEYVILYIKQAQPCNYKEYIAGLMYEHI